MSHLPQNTTTPIDYYRIEGCGNNFNLLVSKKEIPFATGATASQWAKGVQDRAFGLSGDGLMVVRPTLPGDADQNADFFVAMFNPDGSAMGMCGNGIRCVVRALYLNGLLTGDSATIRFDVQGRAIVCTTTTAGRHSEVDMGEPSYAPKQIPLSVDRELTEEPVTTPFGTFKITTVSMGNPHAVIFVDDLASVPLTEVGPYLEHHELFPKRANIEFVTQQSDEHFSVRVWERGVGVTFACGTGACAVLMAALKLKRSKKSATMALPGGELSVVYDEVKNRVSLSGPTQEITHGTLYEDFLIRCSRGEYENR